MQVKIEKLVFGGQGLAHLPDGQAVFVWNALPGEEVEIELLKKRKGVAEAVATRIVTASPDRIEPRESHWLATSPWQHISPAAELREKRIIAAETYSKIGDLIINPDDLQIVSGDSMYGYRNKMEFSFTQKVPPLIGEGEGGVSLAFFERGKKNHLPATGSLLAHPAINATAQYILSWINAQKIPLRSLKSLIVREGNNQTIAALFIKDELAFSNYPVLTDTFLGFHLYYSTHLSPASVPTKLLYSAGQDYLITELKGTKLKFGLLSFFQINVPVFNLALDDIAAFLQPKIPVIDYYSGVGAISLPLSRSRERTDLVDNNAEAIAYARENIALNNRENCAAHCLPAEEIGKLIQENQMIILDPPRAGLHQKLISRLLIKKPMRIIYLSCNLATHARDLKLLSQEYKLSFLKLYNFFPRTPHIEGLAVLDRLGPPIDYSALV